MHRWRPYLLTIVVSVAVLAVIAATVFIFGREQVVFEEHVAEFDRLAELKIAAAMHEPVDERIWLRGSSIAPQEARDLIAQLHLSAAGIYPTPFPATGWEFYARQGGGYGEHRMFILSTDTTRRDTSRAITTSRLGGWWYEIDGRR